MPVVPPMDELQPSSHEGSQREGSSRPAAPAGQVEKKNSSSSTPNGSGNAKEKGWIEGVDYAYEYVPVTQRRQGRKNM
ncbi:uncharacterized protein I303_101477 [Kwoniella dejecticola CBS 10117]|uniref:Uncharacterized protein n=1 Tax=Kwoniella dejecticola CBS 10117 TaxID=1296121 RepID=A0A1A6ADM9_9TREE|nr:uncharacterized protein I303_02390 [Kwoniella dejecticola CBS 10117]OBR88170.1 hypothetical protein I303_02390 [Kwoniella dejecticola CBS 10117]